MQRRANSSVVLVTLMLVGLAVIGTLGIANGRDLLHRQWSEPSPPLTVYQVDASSNSLNDPSTAFYWTVDAEQMISEQPVTVDTGLFAPGKSAGDLGWLLWNSLPSVVVALAALVLMVAAGLTARRRGLYAGATLRLLRIVGLVSILGGAGSVLLEGLASRWYPHPDASGPTLGSWQPVLVWVLLGSGVLAVAEMLVRARALRSELDGVI